MGIENFVPRLRAFKSGVVLHSNAVRKLVSKRKAQWKINRQLPSAENLLIYNVLTTNLKEALNEEAVIKETKIINSGNVGKFYKHVNERLNHRTGIPPILTSNNVIVVSDLEKADCFSEYYAKIGTIDNNCIPDNWSASAGLSNGSPVSEPK